MTQFGRARSELNIEILCANALQATGRVERANWALEDRLVKELRLAEISGMASGNAFLPNFIAEHNARFARLPARSDNLQRPLNEAASRLKDILCVREKRLVCMDLAVHCERGQVIPHQCETFAFADGWRDQLWKGGFSPIAF